MMIKLTTVREIYVPAETTKKGKVKKDAFTERRAFEIYLSHEQVKYVQPLPSGTTPYYEGIKGPDPVTELGLSDEFAFQVMERGYREGYRGYDEGYSE